MQISTYIDLVWRGFLIAAVIAVITVVGELVLVLLTGTFTSFFSLTLFACMVGFIPVYPSPSRISQRPISFTGRLLLLLEITILVISAIYASSEYMAYQRIVSPIDVVFPAYVYSLVVVIMGVGNFRRLKGESALAGQDLPAK